MQQFLNNWSATLLAPAAAADLELTIAADVASLLPVGGDFYCMLTLVGRDESGAEVAREIVRVNSALGGVLSVVRDQEGTFAPATWPAGTDIFMRLTAGALQRWEEATQAGGGEGGSITAANMVELLDAGWAGQAPTLFWSADGVGAYGRHQPGREFSFASMMDFSSTSFLELYEGHSSVEGSGAGANLWPMPYGEGMALGTGSTDTGSMSLTVSPDSGSGFTAPAPVYVDQLDTAEARLQVRHPSSASSAQNFVVEIELPIPGIGPIKFRQSTGNMTYHYNAGGSEQSFDAGFSMGTFDQILCVSVTPEGDDHRVEFATRGNWSSPSKTVRGSWLASTMDQQQARLGYKVGITKSAGAQARTVQVKRYAAFATFKY